MPVPLCLNGDISCFDNWFFDVIQSKWSVNSLLLTPLITYSRSDSCSVVVSLAEDGEYRSGDAGEVALWDSSSSTTNQRMISTGYMASSVNYRFVEAADVQAERRHGEVESGWRWLKAMQERQEPRKRGNQSDGVDRRRYPQWRTFFARAIRVEMIYNEWPSEGYLHGAISRKVRNKSISGWTWEPSRFSLNRLIEYLAKSE